LSFGRRITVAQDKHFSVTSWGCGSESGNRSADEAPQVGHENSAVEERRNIEVPILRRQNSQCRTTTKMGSRTNTLWRGQLHAIRLRCIFDILLGNCTVSATFA
jgi:hypothetical protein